MYQYVWPCLYLIMPLNRSSYAQICKCYSLIYAYEIYDYLWDQHFDIGRFIVGNPGYFPRSTFIEWFYWFVLPLNAHFYRVQAIECYIYVWSVRNSFYIWKMSNINSMLIQCFLFTNMYVCMYISSCTLHMHWLLNCLKFIWSSYELWMKFIWTFYIMSLA